MDQQLKDLLDFCRGNNRVCPNPDEWNKFWKALPNRKRVGVGWSPPLPLILAAWWETSDEQKRQRLEQHIRWAYEHQVFEKTDKMIRSLSEDQWYHSDG